MNPSLLYTPKNVIATFTDKYGDERIVHAPRGGRAVRVANNTPGTAQQIVNRAVAILTAGNIKKMRALRGLSGAEVLTRAGMAGVSLKQRMHEIENATRGEGLRFGTLYCLAQAMECDVTELLPTMQEVREFSGVAPVSVSVLR